MTVAMHSSKPTWAFPECGICEKEVVMKKEEALIWPNFRSRFVHKLCFLKIKDSQVEAMQEILKLFEHMPSNEKEAAHVRSTRAVRLACRTTMIAYLEKHGPEALKGLFNSVGKAAAIRIPKL